MPNADTSASAAADTAAADRNNQTSYPLRNDTIFGICAALGDLFGFNPLFLRVAISLLVIFNLKLAIALYLGLGLVVALGYLIFPRRREAAAVPNAMAPAAQANDSAPAADILAA